MAYVSSTRNMRRASRLQNRAPPRMFPPPLDRERPRPQQPRPPVSCRDTLAPMSLLIRYLRHYWPLVVLALVLAAINQIFSLLDPLIFQILQIRLEVLKISLIVSICELFSLQAVLCGKSYNGLNWNIFYQQKKRTFLFN